MTRLTFLCWLPLVLMTLACVQQAEVEPPSSVFPTAVAIVEIPTPTVATVTPATATTIAPVPHTPAVQASMSESQYAEACGEVMTIDLTDMTREEYAGWVQSFADLNPPDSLVDWHHSVLNIYELKLKSQITKLDLRLPYIQLARAVMSLDEIPGRLLERESCHRRSSVELSRVIADARERLAGYTSSSDPMTVEEYAVHCAEVTLAAPWARVSKHLRSTFTNSSAR